MKYRIIEKGFPIEIMCYYQYNFNGCDEIRLGDVEIYRTGKIYFKDNFINVGISINQIQKILKIAKKELRKEKIRQFFKCS